MKSSPLDLIERPSGGGAIKGLGEKFSPDLFSGAGKFEIPLELPKGRNGLQPKLALSYASTQGSSPFGLGWSIPMASIRRRTSKGVPTYDDDRDVFVLSGEEDLVPLADGGGRYRPRTEVGFARISHVVDRATGSDFWEVRRADGSVSLFGTPKPADAPADWQDEATLSDPAFPGHIFEWKLSETRDALGNVIRLGYERDDVAGGRRRSVQSYLSELRYADYGDPSAPSFLVTVRLVYEDRPDPFSHYRSGFEIRTARRCRRIEIETHAGEARRGRTIGLRYVDELGKPELLPPNGCSLLAEIRVSAHDSATDRSEALPALTLQYGVFDLSRRRLRAVVAPELPFNALTDGRFELVDLTGDGLPDVVEMDEVVRYWKNLGEGRYAPPRTMTTAPPGAQLKARGVQLLDADGDGRIDLVVSRGGLHGYYPLSHAGSWDRRAFVRQELSPPFDLEDPEVKLVDLDGDGVTDAIRSGTSFECYFQDPQRGWSSTRPVERRALEEFPDVSFSDPHVRWADMSGDGLSDIVLVHNGRIDYWPALGSGRFGPRVTMRGAPRLPLDFDPKRVLLGDVDGDGVADLIYVDDGEVLLWINRGGASWSPPYRLRGTPRVTDQDAVRIVDLMGTGVAGILWSGIDAGVRDTRLHFLELAGTHKPYLLEELANGAGSVTRVEYASSSRYSLADEAKGRPWRVHLPFPVQVVARVVTTDRFSGGSTTSEYAYHHGYWDGVEREFRGFGRVDQHDSESSVDLDLELSPPTESRNWFHLGAARTPESTSFEVDLSNEYWAEDPTIADVDVLARQGPRLDRDAVRTLRGRTLRTETYVRDGSPLQERPLTVSESVYAVQPVASPSASPVYSPILVATRVTEWERGHDPRTRLELIGGHDVYARPRLTLRIAVPRGRDYHNAPATAASPFIATLDTKDYAKGDDAATFIIDRVAHQTTYEVEEGPQGSAWDLWTSVRDGNATRHVIGQTLHHYDGEAYVGLELGQLGSAGALMRSESLTLTEDILTRAYGAVRPAYLSSDEEPIWPTEYPPEFRSSIDRSAKPPPRGRDIRGGYVLHEADDVRIGGFFKVEVARALGARGMILAQRDALGRETTFVHDDYDLLVVRVTDPANLTVTVEQDYRVLQPRSITDANGNVTAYGYGPLGLVESVAVLGRPGGTEGDDIETPSSTFEYELDVFEREGRPNNVRARRRCRHARAPAPPAGVDPDGSIESRHYYDGSGRLLQTRTLAEDGTGGDSDGSAAVIVSAWRTYDGKGNALATYEPFRSTGWDYVAPSESERGLRSTVVHDAKGRAIRTTMPNGAELRAVFGTPRALDTPDEFAPSPWIHFDYDANDNAGRAGDADPAASSYAGHWNTPSSELSDALGRVVEQVERVDLDPAHDLRIVRSYDARGNLVSIRDSAGRLAYEHVHDLAKQCLRTKSLDGGVSTAVFTATGAFIERRDAKGAIALESRDAAGRPWSRWARDNDNEGVTLRERIVHGDASESGLSEVDAKAGNLRGRIFRHYDEAGLATFASYDFKGNVREKVRTPLAEAVWLTALASNDATYRVDWQPPDGVDFATHAAASLSDRSYATSLTFDALDRVEAGLYPQTSGGTRRAVSMIYGLTGLTRVSVDDVVFVDHVTYDARKRRTWIAYGDPDPARPGPRIMTTYTHDPKTLRLARAKTEGFRRNGPAYEPTGEVLLDTSYSYDLAGNPLTVTERAPGSGLPETPGPLVRELAYDPLYRLVFATGREHQAPLTSPWSTAPRGDDITKTQPYNERYSYDAAGNLRTLEHWDPSSLANAQPTRKLVLEEGTNRPAKVTLGATEYGYRCDPAGNLVSEGDSRRFEWDHANRLRGFKVQAGVVASVRTIYAYDDRGRRVTKATRTQDGRVEVTTYVDSAFEVARIFEQGITRESATLHVVDGSDRIASVRVGDPLPGDETPAVGFHVADSTGNSRLVVDQSGAWIRREEYSPFGETSFGGFSRKRYRYTGRERDEESGLSYHAARYYAPWLCRWTSCDPAGTADGLNPYRYARNSPIRHSDVSGLASDEGPPAWLEQRPKESAALLAGPPPPSGPRIEAWSGRGDAPPEHVGPVLSDAAGKHAEHRLEQMTTNPTYALSYHAFSMATGDPKRASLQAEAFVAMLALFSTRMMQHPTASGAPPKGYAPGNQSASSYKPQTSNAKGELGSGWSFERGQAEGYVPVRHEVLMSIRVPGKGDVTIRADRLWRLPEGGYLVNESKFSVRAPFTPNQREVYPMMIMAGDAGVTATMQTSVGDLKKGDKINVQIQIDIWDRRPVLYGW